MTRIEYASFQANVRRFMEREGIENLAHEGEDSCFSWRGCECCGTSKGGGRVTATGYNRDTDEAQHYTVCEDCIYYAQYGQLDDQTMLDMERKGGVEHIHSHIRTWWNGDYRLEVYETGQYRNGRGYLAYQLFHRGKRIFEADYFSPSPLHSWDGDRTVSGILSFLAVQPDDTDPDYFADYTQEQLDWVNEFGEELWSLQSELCDRESHPYDHLVGMLLETPFEELVMVERVELVDDDWLAFVNGEDGPAEMECMVLKPHWGFVVGRNKLDAKATFADAMKAAFDGCITDSTSVPVYHDGRHVADMELRGSIIHDKSYLAHI